jgi:hypothetical protein
MRVVYGSGMRGGDLGVRPFLAGPVQESDIAEHPLSGSAEIAFPNSGICV